MPLPHIYWFAYYNFDEPSVRYRAKYPLKDMADKGLITYDLVIPGYSPPIVYKFLKTYFAIIFSRKQQSVIVFEKIHTTRFYASALKLLLRLQPNNTLYDIDDADYLKFPPRNIYYFMKNCAGCTAGSHELVKSVQKMNARVTLLTSPVIEHKFAKVRRNKLFTVGWVGYYNAHRESLRQLFFPALLQLNFPVKLILLGVTKAEHHIEISRYFSANSNITIEVPEAIDWQDENALYESIVQFDVGVAPLLPTEINKAKSAFKIKQYLSCGVPVLGSATGENNVFLHHGINGYACHNPEDYAQYLETIASMPDAEYTTMSANAVSGKTSFSVRTYTETFLSALNF